RYIQRDRERVGERERTARDTLRQRLAIVVRHRHVELAVARLADLVDRADVRMLQRRCRLRLRDEARLRIAVRAEVWREKLELYDAVESGIACPIDHADPAAAQPRELRVAWEVGEGTGPLQPDPRDERREHAARKKIERSGPAVSEKQLVDFAAERSIIP